MLLREFAACERPREIQAAFTSCMKIQNDVEIHYNQKDQVSLASRLDPEVNTKGDTTSAPNNRKNIKQRGAKQLLTQLYATQKNVDRKLAAISLSRTSGKTQRKRQSPSSKTDNAMAPVTMANTMRNGNKLYTTTQSGTEIVGRFNVTNTLPAKGFGLSTINMSPPTLLGSRLAELSKAFEKYRFRRLKLRVQSTSGTSTTGAYIVGYAENPDMKVPAWPLSERAIQNLRGATSKSLWLGQECEGYIVDKNKWYNIDEDSTEIMQTIQGKFLILQQSVSSLTKDIDFIVYLDYTIELSGSAIQTTEGTSGPSIIKWDGTIANLPKESPSAWAFNGYDSGAVQNAVLYELSPVVTLGTNEIQATYMNNLTVGKNTYLALYRNKEDAIEYQNAITGVEVGGDVTTIVFSTYSIPDGYFP